eukprot:TRINITY_DN1194_c0_g1_i1.p1 TRINITY_DN1194_c0_g1~~TRINITY_DN1194_c0_g1_i1.p1  ORF type:complete len:289 (+),score=57.92 TRINITY_DN1194_c0_g1_i1:303-1169(+)
MAASATMAAVVCVSGAQLQGSASSSFVNGGANVVMPVSAPRSLKYKMVARASSQESREGSSRAARREVLAGLMAAGALLVGNNGALAAGPGSDGADQTQKFADGLLKQADKLTNEESPLRYGPSQLADSGSAGLGDASKAAQQAGSGAAQNVQDGLGSVADATKDSADKLKKGTEDAIGGTGDLGKTLEGFFGQGKKAVGQAQDSADDAVKSSKNIFGQIQDKPQEVIGDAQDKITNATESGKQEAGNLFGNLPNPFKALKDTVASKEAEVKDAIDDVNRKAKDNRPF